MEESFVQGEEGAAGRTEQRGKWQLSKEKGGLGGQGTGKCTREA